MSKDPTDVAFRKALKQQKKAKQVAAQNARDDFLQLSAEEKKFREDVHSHNKLVEAWKDNPSGRHHLLASFGGRYQGSVSCCAYLRLLRWFCRWDKYSEVLYDDTIAKRFEAYQILRNSVLERDQMTHAERNYVVANGPHAEIRQRYMITEPVCTCCQCCQNSESCSCYDYYMAEKDYQELKFYVQTFPYEVYNPILNETNKSKPSKESKESKHKSKNKNHGTTILVQMKEIVPGPPSQQMMKDDNS